MRAGASCEEILLTIIIQLKLWYKFFNDKFMIIQVYSIVIHYKTLSLYTEPELYNIFFSYEYSNTLITKSLELFIFIKLSKVTSFSSQVEDFLNSTLLRDSIRLYSYIYIWYIREFHCLAKLFKLKTRHTSLVGNHRTDDILS